MLPKPSARPRTNNRSLPASCNKLPCGLSRLGLSFLTQLDPGGLCDLAKTALAGGIFHYAGTVARLDFRFNPRRHGRFPRAPDFIPNVLARETEAVANRDRVCRLLGADANGKVLAAECRCFRVQGE